MSNCDGCSSEYMPSGETWDMKNMYRPSNFNPFLVSGKIPYGPPGCVQSGYILPPPPKKENFYASGTTSWTTCGNVTPANSPTYGTQPVPVKESCCGPTPYKMSSKTWKLQKPYTS